MDLLGITINNNKTVLILAIRKIIQKRLLIAIIKEVNNRIILIKTLRLWKGMKELILEVEREKTLFRKIWGHLLNLNKRSHLLQIQFKMPLKLITHKDLIQRVDSYSIR